MRGGCRARSRIDRTRGREHGYECLVTASVLVVLVLDEWFESRVVGVHIVFVTCIVVVACIGLDLVRGTVGRERLGHELDRFVVRLVHRFVDGRSGNTAGAGRRLRGLGRSARIRIDIARRRRRRAGAGICRIHSGTGGRTCHDGVGFGQRRRRVFGKHILPRLGRTAEQRIRAEIGIHDTRW